MLTATAAKPISASLDTLKSSWRRRALSPVPADSLALFRICFGLLISFSSLRFLANGWVGSLYLEPEHHLTYAGFGWARPLPAPWMHLLIASIAVLGFCIAAGYRHRLACGLFIVAFGYTELIEASLYLNHYWFLTVTAVLLFFLPVQHRWSVDAQQGRVLQSRLVPAVAVWALRAQLAVAYFFAGVAKLNPAWLFQAQPLQLWFSDRADTPIVGFVLAEPVTASLASWAALAFDLTIVAWLLWRPTRKWAYAALVVFHLTTGALFQIGVFPWVMIVAALVFFEPGWPSKLRRQGFGEVQKAPEPKIRRPTLVLLAFLAAVQIFLPLRHYAYPSNVRWSEEGYYLSWRVMLSDKVGHVNYHVADPATGEAWETGPELVLTDWQASHAATRPDLIHATAQLIADHYGESGIPNVEVRTDALVSLNGEPLQPLIDPTVNLAAEPRTLAAHDWILLYEPADG